MITLRYVSNWEVRYEASSGEEKFIKKTFSYKDLKDYQSFKRFGYFPDVLCIDTVEKRMSHGQALHLQETCKKIGIPVTVVNEPHRHNFNVDKIPADYLPGKTLYDFQQLVSSLALNNFFGIVKLPTSSGKTIIMGTIVKWLVENTKIPGIMIMIFSKDLLNQTAKRFQQYGVPADDIGIVHSDISPEDQKKEAAKRVVLTTHLSIKKFTNTIDRTEIVLCDEAHETKGALWSAMLKTMPNLKNVVGFTATPWDNDNEKFDMLSIFGKVICEIPIQFLVKRKLVMNPEIYFIDLRYKDRDKQMLAQMSWQTAEKELIINEPNRNLLPILALKKFGGRMLVLFDKIDHGEILFENFKKYGFDVRMADGETKTSVRDECVKWFEKDPEAPYTGKVLLGSKIFNQGVDIQGGCDILFIIGATKKERRQTQGIGRALRLNRSGRLLVFSVWDGNHPKLSAWSGERKRVFTELGFDVKKITVEEFKTLQ